MTTGDIVEFEGNKYAEVDFHTWQDADARGDATFRVYTDNPVTVRYFKPYSPMPKEGIFYVTIDNEEEHVAQIQRHWSCADVWRKDTGSFVGSFGPDAPRVTSWRPL